MRAPLWIVGAGFVGIADGDSLHVGLLQEVEHDAEPLGANADKSNVYFVAGRNIAKPAEDATRDDGEAERCGRGLRQKFAAGDGICFRVRRGKLFFHGAASVAEDGANSRGVIVQGGTLHRFEPFEYCNRAENVVRRIEVTRLQRCFLLAVALETTGRC